MGMPPLTPTIPSFMRGRWDHVAVSRWTVSSLNAVYKAKPESLIHTWGVEEFPPLLGPRALFGSRFLYKVLSAGLFCFILRDLMLWWSSDEEKPQSSWGNKGDSAIKWFSGKLQHKKSWFIADQGAVRLMLQKLLYNSSASDWKVCLSWGVLFILDLISETVVLPKGLNPFWWHGPDSVF